MTYQHYQQSTFLYQVHREARINRIADGLRQVNPDIMAMFWARHDASKAMFDRCHELCREGQIEGGAEGVQAWLANAKKDLPPEVCLKCESVLDIPRDLHVCPEDEAEIMVAFRQAGGYQGEDFYPQVEDLIEF